MQLSATQDGHSSIHVDVNGKKKMKSKYIIKKDTLKAQREVVL